MAFKSFNVTCKNGFVKKISVPDNATNTLEKLQDYFKDVEILTPTGKSIAVKVEAIPVPVKVEIAKK